MKSLGIDPRSPIYADSAEPKTIEEIRRSGFNIQPTVKGADSITFGITILQEQNILITSSSVNLIKEFRNYTWDKDKTGAKLNKPIDDWNHGIDATRYFAMMALKKKSESFVLVNGKIIR
jgi:phage terminase large subunit